MAQISSCFIVLGKIKMNELKRCNLRKQQVLTPGEARKVTSYNSNLKKEKLSAFSVEWPFIIASAAHHCEERLAESPTTLLRYAADICLGYDQNIEQADTQMKTKQTTSIDSMTCL